MLIEERHREILRLLTEKGRITVSEIEEAFDVSNDSARRDLRILESKGLLKRTHGGALPAVQVGFHPPDKYDPRDVRDIRENYLAIAKSAAEMIRENDVVYITSGFVGFLMLRFLPTDRSFTLVLNNIVLADEVKYRDNITVYLVGGKMRHKGTMVDSFAVEFVKNMHFDVAFITGGGLSADFGFSNGTHETAVFQKAVLSNARRRVLLMPAAKIGAHAFVKVSDASLFDLLITDREAVEDELARLEEAGLEILIADAETEE